MRTFDDLADTDLGLEVSTSHGAVEPGSMFSLTSWEELEVFSLTASPCCQVHLPGTSCLYTPS